MTGKMSGTPAQLNRPVASAVKKWRLTEHSFAASLTCPLCLLGDAPKHNSRGNELKKFGLAVCLASLFGLVVGLSGCHEHVVHASVSRMVPPTPIAAHVPAPPDIRAEDSGSATLAIVTFSEPVAPAEPVHTVAPAHKPETTPRPVAPQISQQISPADEAAYKQKTNGALTIAESNLRQTEGKQLNSSQRDMVEKIEGFVSQSREALAGSDWTRAQNLAKKAEVLSNELVSSL